MSKLQERIPFLGAPDPGFATPRLLDDDAAERPRMGIPRALLYHRYAPLWRTYFDKLGFEVVESPATDRALLDRGRALSSDETCLASKAFMGHVDALVGACDAVFVPSYASVARRSGFCTKFQSITDMTANAMRGSGTPIVSCLVENLTDSKGTAQAFVDMGVALGAKQKDAEKAWKAAVKAQKSANDAAAKAQKAAFKQLDADRAAFDRAKKAGTLPKSQECPLGILVAAHPYIDQDAYLSETILEGLRSRGCRVFLAHETDHEAAYEKSFEFSDTMPWRINRELIGSILLNHDRIDGIVMISAFPCGPDSMTDDAIMRCIHGKPILNLMIDEQTGTAGIETRVESFIDIIRFQNEGGYVHGA